MENFISKNKQDAVMPPNSLKHALYVRKTQGYLMIIWSCLTRVAQSVIKELEALGLHEKINMPKSTKTQQNLKILKSKRGEKFKRL